VSRLTKVILESCVCFCMFFCASMMVINLL